MILGYIFWIILPWLLVDLSLQSTQIRFKVQYPSHFKLLRHLVINHITDCITSLSYWSARITVWKQNFNLEESFFLVLKKSEYTIDFFALQSYFSFILTSSLAIRCKLKQHWELLCLLWHSLPLHFYCCA